MPRRPRSWRGCWYRRSRWWEWPQRTGYATNAARTPRGCGRCTCYLYSHRRSCFLCSPASDSWTTGCVPAAGTQFQSEETTMEVILLQKVANLGNIGDRVKVKPGFGRNFLLPQGKAALATAANVAKFEERRTDLEKRAADDLASARTRAARLEGHALSITAKVG